ncbi:DUF3293 domain-containing protein [Pseudomethylobacillus aquaticus]|uniref:DUF3293 domain-containing protein n=2 Tax=Pseudomethylobacillus aquaticus TaxID=2676064 RepID=A0A3N0V0W1_9PROT|nr:DUF3293 domain-containing protein [Pseudomethylobacillus aquaticus]
MEDAVNHSVLHDAYMSTDYVVMSEPAFTLKVGIESSALSQLHKSYGVDSSVFITAWNPGSVPRSKIENEKRQVELMEILRFRSLDYFHAEGIHPSGQWPAEPSVLVLGLSLEAGKKLGRQFSQNAILWAGPDAKPTLVMINAL